MTDIKIPVHRTFGDFLQGIRGGQFHQTVTDELTKLIGALFEHQEEFGDTGAKGTITLKFAIARKDDVLHITPDMTAKAPVKPKKTAMMYMTSDGQLTNYNPQQQELPYGAVREVSTTSPGMRTV